MKARDWVPSGIRRVINRALGTATTYRGPYGSWAQAQSESAGYAAAPILDRVASATMDVLQGRADYEQDGVTFTGAFPASHALSGLLLAASLDGGKLSVLDLGGGLATHYLRWRRALSALASVRWAVVEQPLFVSTGRRLFRSDTNVSFHDRIDQLTDRPNAALVSSTLQYLEDPRAAVRALSGLGCKVVVIDRTPYSEDGVERIAIQQVPRSLGLANYPVRMLSRDSIHEELSAHHALAWEFDAPDEPMSLGATRASFRGSVWIRSR